MLKKYEPALIKIEREVGVDRYSLLAIWGRETAFGTYKLPHDAVRVLATEAYVGRRKEMFRQEIIAALKMLQMGVPRAMMRSSWAGAVGLTQFMPTEFITYAPNADGTRLDIWNSVPDALTAAGGSSRAKAGCEARPGAMRCACHRVRTARSKARRKSALSRNGPSSGSCARAASRSRRPSSSSRLT